MENGVGMKVHVQEAARRSHTQCSPDKGGAWPALAIAPTDTYPGCLYMENEWGNEPTSAYVPDSSRQDAGAGMG